MTTAADYFNTVFPAKLLARPEISRSIGGKVQTNVSGPKGGAWILDLKSNPPTCKPGTEAADCVVAVSDEVFEKKILRGDDPYFLDSRGEVTVTGWKGLFFSLMRFVQNG